MYRILEPYLIIENSHIPLLGLDMLVLAHGRFDLGIEHQSEGGTWQVFNFEDATYSILTI